MEISIRLESGQTSVELMLVRDNDSMLKSVIFAIVMLIICYGPFTGLVAMLGGIG